MFRTERDNLVKNTIIGYSRMSG